MKKQIFFFLLFFPWSAHADFALIHEQRVVQVEANRFPVAPALTWVDITVVNPKPVVGWSYDGQAFSAPPAPPARTSISYETFQDRFTAAEFNAATDFVYETDLVTGKPKRRALIQGLSRAMSKNSVGLLEARTIAFMDALVAGGVITEARKNAILAP